MQINKLMTPVDRIILGGAIVWLIGLYGYYWRDHTEFARYAIILAPQHLPYRVDLTQDQWVTINGTLGESVLQVEKGRIRFFSSPCHNKYCIHSGWLQQQNDFVACIPNQVSIELYNNQQDQQKLDAISY